MASTPRRVRVTRIAIVLALVPAAAIGTGLSRLGESPATETVTTLAGSGTSPSTRAPARVPYPDAASSAPVRVTGGTSPSPSRRPTTTRTTPTGTRTTTRRPAVGLTAPAQQLTDLRYVTGSASPAQTLDLYLPERSGRPVPLVIDIHGGAFMAGGKSEDRGRIDALVADGYAVASPNYRLTDEAPFPAGVKDVKAAVRWLRASSARYGIDPDAFAAWGDSAGGYFATMLGTTSRQRTTFDDPALGNATVSSAVQAVVAFYAPVDFATMDAQAADPVGCTQGAQAHDEAGSPESRWLGRPLPSAVATVRAANPLTYLRATPAPPPFFVAHGTQDCNVPHGQSLELVKALKAKGVPQSLTLLDGVGHGGAEFGQLQGRVIAFLNRTVGRG
ncbi:MAG: alpha/beta hydrolase [Kineosporiaceae bacterium]